MHDDCPRVVILADDLTGAMDSAVPFCQRGLRVAVSPDPGIDSFEVNGVEVLAISTNTRHCAPPEATARVAETCKRLPIHKAQLLIKKIDSTLRGNVASESRALIDACGRESAIICPAVPAQKRTVVDGTLYVDGLILSQTAFGRDLRSAPPTSSLRELFQGQFPGWQIIAEKPPDTTRVKKTDHTRTLTIGDAEHDADLLRLVRARAEVIKDSVFIGASGLAEALAETLYGPAIKPSHPGPTNGSLLFVIGSPAKETDAQLKILCAENPYLTLVEIANGNPLEAPIHDRLVINTKEPNIIVLKAPMISTFKKYDPEKISAALADSVDAIIQFCNIGAIVATGGDTAQAILAKLDIKSIMVSGEIEQGVVYGTIDTAARPVFLVTKAGGFGKPELFLKVLHFFSCP
jgi:uncharacterized protein YgbK (DUF1537 family)